MRYEAREKAEKRAEAAEAEVKRIKQMSLGSIYKEAQDRLEAAEARLGEATARIETNARLIALLEQEKRQACWYENAEHEGEKGRLEANAATERTLRLSLEGERNAAEARVRELEEDGRRVREIMNEEIACVRRDREALKAELAAKEAVTIEWCATVADRIDSVNGIGAAIRAIKEPAAAPPAASE